MVRTVTVTAAEVEPLRKLVADIQAMMSPETSKIISGNEPKRRLHGLVGEFAFAKLTGLPFSDKPQEGGDKGRDFTLSNGETVDTKTAVFGSRNDCKLMAPHPATFKADRIVLMRLPPCWQLEIDVSGQTDVDAMGYVRSDEFNDKRLIGDFGYGPTDYIPASELRPIKLRGE